MTVTTPTGALCPFFISRKHTKHTKKGRNPATARLSGCVSVTQEYTKHTKWDAGICVFCAFLFFDTQPARYATTGFSVFFVCFVPFWVFSDLSKQITPPPFWLASLAFVSHFCPESAQFPTVLHSNSPQPLQTRGSRWICNPSTSKDQGITGQVGFNKGCYVIM